MFIKGQSGNPGGRPKVTLADGRTLKDLARDHTETAVDTLVRVMSDEEAPHPARVSAASAILDRGWGKPTQEFEAGPDLLTTLADLVATRRAAVAALNTDGQ